MTGASLRHGACNKQEAEGSEGAGQQQDGEAAGPSAGDLASQMDADIEEKRKRAAAAAWGGQPPKQPADVESVPEATSNSKAPQSLSSNGIGEKQLTNLSVEELEAELARRKAATKKPE